MIKLKENGALYRCCRGDTEDRRERKEDEAVLESGIITDLNKYIASIRAHDRCDCMW